MTGGIVVEAPARLHLGFYRPCRSAGRVLGGVGLAIDIVWPRRLATRVVYEPDGSTMLRVVAPPACLGDAAAAAENARGLYGASGTMSVVECLPRHVGLGSTTQLVLSVYAAAAAAAGFPVERAAADSGRGFFSGVGVGVFLRGGLVVDTGAVPGSRLARPMAWTGVPEDWGIVIVLAGNARSRLVAEGPQEERAILSALDAVDEAGCREGYSILLDLVLPGAAEGDFDLFTKGVEALEELAARLFGRQQGGMMCCREAEEAAEALRGLGGRGVGQSSWGPAVYGFFPSFREAREAAEALAGRLSFGAVFAARPRARGALVLRV